MEFGIFSVRRPEENQDCQGGWKGEPLKVGEKQ